MGHFLTVDGLKPDESKVKVITEMPRPKDKKADLHVLGMTNYLQRFVQCWRRRPIRCKK
jgi:hypothetical protein